MTKHHSYLLTDIPGAPVNLQISTVTSSAIHLTWSPPLVSETLGLAIYSYVVTCSTGPQQHDASVKTTDGQRGMFSQLHPSTQYNCCVAVNSENGRGKSACLSAITGEHYTARYWIASDSHSILRQHTLVSILHIHGQNNISNTYNLF